MESSPSDNTPRLQYPSLPMGTFPWTPTSPISSQMMSSYDLMPGLVSDPSIWPLDDDLSFQPHHQQSLQHPYQQNHGVNSDSMIDSIIYSSLPTTNQPIIYNQQQQQQFIFPPTPPFNSAPTTLPMLNNSSRETTPPFSNTTNSPISQSSSTPPPGTTLVDYHPILSYPSNVQNPPIAPANNTPRRKSTGSTRTYRRRASSHPSVASVVSLTAHEPVSTIIEGIEYITFLYSHERLVKRYTVRTDVESVRLEDIPLEFRVQNAVSFCYKLHHDEMIYSIIIFIDLSSRQCLSRRIRW